MLNFVDEIFSDVKNIKIWNKTGKQKCERNLARYKNSLKLKLSANVQFMYEKGVQCVCARDAYTKYREI